jgi:PUB domain
LCDNALSEKLHDDSSLLDAANCRQQSLRTKYSQELAYHHPQVKLPPRLEEKSKKEQIQRCCSRLKSYPATVDALIRALATIIGNPSVSKYRRIDQTNPGYQHSLAAAPGLEPFLQALGFVPMMPQILFLPQVNRDLLEIALNTLKRTTMTREYQLAKSELSFAREVAALLSTTVERRLLLSRVPMEPSEGRSAVIMIQLPAEKTLTRRFEGDDTLQDVLNWLGGMVGTLFLDELVLTQQWSLVDVNLIGSIPVNCDSASARHQTLQFLGFWPSGRLQLRPSSTEWMERKSSPAVVSGASRTLASAASETI